MSVCAISTCWRARKISDPGRLVSAMRETGLNTFELEFRIRAEVFREIKKNHKNWGIEISSLHAVCPAPPGRKRGAENFQISDTDEEKRRRGVKDVVETMRNGADMGAKAVVVHCGRVPMEEPIYKMMELYDDGKIKSPEAEDKLREITLAREAAGKRSFDSLLKSLDEINEEAEKLQINVGLENRYYFAELPNIHEFGIIFNLFKGGKLRYWHDTGHAHVNETLFCVPHKLLLKKFSRQLAGVHLHDVTGYTDHQAPGGGEVDFDMVNSYLHDETIRVMEPNQFQDIASVKRGIEFLRAKGIFNDADIK